MVEWHPEHTNEEGTYIPPVRQPLFSVDSIDWNDPTTREKIVQWLNGNNEFMNQLGDYMLGDQVKQRDEMTSEEHEKYNEEMRSIGQLGAYDNWYDSLHPASELSDDEWRDHIERAWEWNMFFGKNPHDRWPAESIHDMSYDQWVDREGAGEHHHDPAGEMSEEEEGDKWREGLERGEPIDMAWRLIKHG